MSEGPLERLARLTPAKLDRDDLLFRAGRASARVWRWKVAVAVLAVGQVATLALWLFDRPQPVAVVVPAVPTPPAEAPPPPSEPERPTPFVLRPVEFADPPPPVAVDLAPAGPPLTVLSAYRDPGSF